MAKKSFERNLEESVDRHKALGNKVRLSIYLLLRANGPLSVTKVTNVLRLKQSHVSQSLTKLCQAGLATKERRNQEVFYKAIEWKR